MVNQLPRPNVRSTADEFPKDPYWPFPTKDNPLKVWTAKEVKAYAKLQRENAQESPF